MNLFKLDFMRYGVVGLVSTIIDYIIFNLLFYFLGGEQYLWLATGLGFLAGTINGYFLNSRWTFAYDTKGKETKKFIQFLIISGVGLLFTEAIVLGLAKVIDLDRNIAKAVAVVVVFFWNYFANKYWTFKK